MNFIDTLEDNSILIIPNNLKTKVLVYINDHSILKSIKILSFNDLKKGLLFDYETDAIKATMDYLEVSFNVAKSYVSNLYYINENSYDNEKLNGLLKLKNYLTQNNYLKFDVLFKELLKSKSTIYVYGFDYINLFDKHLLSIASEYIDIEVLEKEYTEYEHTVYEFNTIFDEVSFVFEQIITLVDNGTPLDKIFIANYNNDYAFAFNTLMNLTGLPVYLKSNTTLYSTAIGTYFLNNLSNDIDKLLFDIRKKFKIKTSDENERIYNSLTSLINKYYWCDGDYESISDLIENDMRLRRISVLHHENEITTTNIIDNIFADDEYVFLIGFNLGDIPKIKKDEDYINDAIKPKFLEKTIEYNLITKSTILKSIKNIKNLTITYKLGTPFKACEKSFLCNDKSFTIKKMNTFISAYSDDLNKLNLSKSIDALIKYNTVEDNLGVLINNYDSKYKTYNNAFTGIDDEDLRERLNDNFVFSYSNIVDYYKCPFKFYANHILKIRAFETTLSQFIGSLFHYVLENCLEGDKSTHEAFDEYVNIHISELESTYKNKYFIESLRNEIDFLVETIKEQQSHSSHTKTLYEHEIIIDIERKIKTKIKGFVDKILVLNNYMLVVDYKTTNSQSIDKDIFEFGLSTQLPIYLYLLTAVNNNVEVAGIYVQHILDLEHTYDPNKDYLEEKKKKLKLEGITFDNIDLISKFDDTYEKSNVIKSLSVTKDGTLRKLKNILSEDERKELTSLMEALIMKCIDDVSDAKFDIHPIKIEKHADGCQYCDYKDICFRKFKDFNIQYISKDKGGDDDE